MATWTGYDIGRSTIKGVISEVSTLYVIIFLLHSLDC